MALEVQIHEAQTSILRELLFLPAAGFAELQKPTGLTSDHFMFHINRLVELGLLERVERMRDGRTEYLFQERLKQPYFGYWGLPSGKIRWGETILETALRELKEETGLEADREICGKRCREEF
jgi:8-oxo-dGTP pyrophosphatase MutT (NUDIX family)